VSVVRVLLVDDSADLRLVVRDALEAYGGFEIVGEAADGDRAIELAAELEPELVLLDLDMPGRGGLQALPDIRRAAPRSRVVVLTGLDAVDVRDTSLSGGAVGFLEKGIKARDLVGELLTIAGVVDTIEGVLAERTAHLAGREAAPGAARGLVEAVLRDRSSATTVEIVELLISEVVTNAVVHAGSDVNVAVRLTPATVRVEVTDGSVDAPEVHQSPAHVESGRGLALVQSLSSSWGFEPTGSGKTVWFEVARMDHETGDRAIE
jgi:DNA-binding NarL/FixJ family response regulator